MDKGLLDKILTTAHKHNASDIHLMVGQPPMVRVGGDLLELKYHDLKTSETISAAQVIMAGNPLVDLESFHEFDCSYEVANVARFRVNMFRQRGTIGMVLRLVPSTVLDFQALMLPEVLGSIANLRRGLILVTGATGNGKSTTLAAMLNHINQNRRGHILTVEDPIEFTYPKGKCTITQRELGIDTRSYSTALIAALRQDPDVIMIGELRDTATVDVALKAAETGHLVISTVHTPDAVKTIQRMVGFFQGEEQLVARHRIADNLMAVISLRLVPAKQGGARIPAVEILRATRTVQEFIKSPDKTGELYGVMQNSADFGMQTFDRHLLSLVKDGQVNVAVAKSYATSPEELERNVMLEG